MKKIATILMTMVASIWFLTGIIDANINYENNGQLTKEIAIEWAESKCTDNPTVEAVEGEGYKVSCDSKFQALPGQMHYTIMLGYSKNPDKPFGIYPPY